MSQPTAGTSPASAARLARRSLPAQSRFRVAEGCLDCAGDLEGTLGRLPGVSAVEVLGATGIVRLAHDGNLDPATVAEQARRLGLRLLPADTPATGAASSSGRGWGWWRTPRLLALAAAGVLLLAGLAADKLAHRATLGTALYLATVAVGGIFPVRTAIDVLRRRRLTIGTLLVVATAGALALGVVEEAGMLVVVFSLGGVLEDYVSDRARGAIRALMALAPPTAHRQQPDGRLETVPVGQLQPGEVVLVRPGERLPTDGIVVAGASAVDQSPVTGESLPVEVTPGTSVFGGTVNGTGALTLKVTKPYQDTTLARIIRQVEQAQASPRPRATLRRPLRRHLHPGHGRPGHPDQHHPAAPVRGLAHVGLPRPGRAGRLLLVRAGYLGAGRGGRGGLPRRPRRDPHQGRCAPGDPRPGAGRRAGQDRHPHPRPAPTHRHRRA